jgi:glutamyl-tRNA synthetase
VIRTRFAPSPTGDLHVGGAWTALAAWSMHGTRVLREEDLDTPRNVPGAAAAIREDLGWLGLTWDEGPDHGGPFGPYRQSERLGYYEAAVADLRKLGLVYACDCSRADLARVASAPHLGEELVYPGTCREKPSSRSFRRPPALRLRVPKEAAVRFVDVQELGNLPASPSAGFEVVGHVERDVGDFVLVRGDGVFSYQLAVSVDDAQMGITHVVRGRDLLGSTARQLLLMRLLSLEPPATYIHVPLVLAPDGERLAKRAQGTSIRSLRQAGITAESVVSALAEGLFGESGLATPTAVADFVSKAPRRINPSSYRLPEGWGSVAQ